MSKLSMNLVYGRKVEQMNEIAFSHACQFEPTKDKPLVSIVMTSYNQMDLSLKSLRSVLAQDYENLEIVITDDASQDDSFNILVEECRSFCRNNVNRFSIIVSRNKNNVGVTLNYEIGFKLAHGDLIVTQGGDDIAYPNRVSKIVESWISSGKKSKVIFHKVEPIDLDDKPCGYEWWKMTLRNPIGAAMAYSSDVVRLFPAISRNRSFEDGVYCRRAAIFSEPLYIEEKLLSYRIGSGVTSTGNQRDLRRKISFSMVETAKQNFDDFEYAERHNLGDAERICAMRRLSSEILETYGLEFEMISNPSLLKRIKALNQYVKLPNCMHKPSIKWYCKYYIPLVMPRFGWFTSKL